MTAQPTTENTPAKKFLRPGDVVAQYGISRSTLDRYIKTKKFPEPTRFSKRFIGWPPEVVAKAFQA